MVKTGASSRAKLYKIPQFLWLFPTSPASSHLSVPTTSLSSLQTTWGKGNIGCARGHGFYGDVWRKNTSCSSQEHLRTLLKMWPDGGYLLQPSTAEVSGGGSRSTKLSRSHLAAVTGSRSRMNSWEICTLPTCLSNPAKYCWGYNSAKPGHFWVHEVLWSKCLMGYCEQTQQLHHGGYYYTNSTHHGDTKVEVA